MENDFFGGNVDVTGLLVGQDIVRAIRALRGGDGAVRPERDGGCLVLVPRVVFNDDGLTLDDMVLEDMEREAGCRIHMVSCSPLEYFDQIRALLGAE